MKKNLSLFLIFFSFFIFFSKQMFSQDVNGKWYGIGYPDIQNPANSYLCELVLVQNGNSVTGYFNYFFRDAYVTNYISGSFDKKTHFLSLKQIPIVYYQSTNYGRGVDCRMAGGFTLIASQVESALNGAFESDEFHKFTSPDLKVHFTKQAKDEPTLKEIFDRSIAAKPETPEEKTQRIALKNVQMRRKEIIKILDFTEDSVQIDMYDNAILDYDTVSVFYNNQIIEAKQLLQIKTPLTFKVRLDSADANNDLIMFAENLGQIPPNSGIMIITDKAHRYEVPFESDYIKNAAVRLRKVAPPKYAPYKL